MKEMKKIICIILFLGNVFFVAASFADGLPVFDLAAFLQLGKEFNLLGDQFDELKSHSTYLQQELERLKGGDYQWSDAQSKINEAGGLVKQTTQLAYNASDLDARFKQTFPGYKPPDNYSKQYENIVTNTLNTLNAILQSVGSNANDFQDESKRLKFLQDRAQNAQGQTQAIQAASQIASEEATQLQLLRQTVVAQTNAQTAYYAAQVQKEESSRADMSRIIQAGSSNITGKLNEHPLDLPKL